MFDQPDLFATEQAPALPLARPASNPDAYLHRDCLWLRIEAMPNHVLKLGIARDTDGWHMAAAYHLPEIGYAGPICRRSNAYPTYRAAVVAGQTRLMLMVNGLLLSGDVTQEKAQRLRHAIEDFTSAAELAACQYQEAA